MAGMLVGFTDFSTSMAPSFLLSLLLSSSSSSSMAVQMGEKAAARVGVGRRRRRRAHALVGGDDADGGKGSGAAAQIGEKAAARASGDGGDVRVRCCRRCHRWGEGEGAQGLTTSQLGAPVYASRPYAACPRDWSTCSCAADALLWRRQLLAPADADALLSSSLPHLEDDNRWEKGSTRRVPAASERRVERCAAAVSSGPLSMRSSSSRTEKDATSHSCCKILCPSQLPMDSAVDGPRQPPARAGSRLCTRCSERKAALKRPKTLEQLCLYAPHIFRVVCPDVSRQSRECFYIVFEDEIHQTIVENNLFKPGDRVAIGASGGKVADTTDLLQYGLPLKIISYKDLYGWTMDDIVKAIGLKNNCTFCGVFRRQALDRGAALLKVDKIVTGHNADDIAETVLLNILRGDIARLSRCTFITTGEDGPIPRCKPFKYTYEKEIVIYPYYAISHIFSCIYSPNAYRGFAREFIKDLERMRPRAILDIIKSGENFRISTTTRMPEQGTCERCGYISSQDLFLADLLNETDAN
ncbi:Os01g0598900 [Oryza sativa Japonica Group]|uniref:Os01g0598900 protein n=1 Tax=Oryza sativa subsp. japonica TaxID=39947 RepID=C7IWU1_ORYSJ|nr:Os01g0598900 [Oryza sativa Japonica Group]|eukprot:NP_001172449.1 Os01g0598900 [Oryza sativa Japonica Group]